MRNKKLLTTVAALTTAAALTLGGTFAWQSISQNALNESTDTINPGGRLHNDIAAVATDPNSTYNFIYVENFSGDEQDDGSVTGGEDIYARIRLEEYMELVMNYGMGDMEIVKNIAGAKTLKDGVTDVSATGATRQNKFNYTYELHFFDEGKTNAADGYWTWQLGDEANAENYGGYMPTFNKNKDSLAVDQNGSYTAAIGGIVERENNYATDFVSYAADDEKNANAIYDNDGNDADELAALSSADLNDIITNGDRSAKWNGDYADAVHLESETHTARDIPETKGVISMAAWLELDAAEQGSYWVYDTDGWVYWSSAIKPGDATGPLLEGFGLKHEMDDTWYYAINVVAQFITADDLGKADSTGFYDENGWYDPTGLGTEKAAAFEGAGQAPSGNALKLLEKIGVDVSEASLVRDLQLVNTSNSSIVPASFVEINKGDTVRITDLDGSTPENVYVRILGIGDQGDTDPLLNTYDETRCSYEEGILTFYDDVFSTWDTIAFEVEANTDEWDSVGYVIYGATDTLAVNKGETDRRVPGGVVVLDGKETVSYVLSDDATDADLELNMIAGSYLIGAEDWAGWADGATGSIDAAAKTITITGVTNQLIKVTSSVSSDESYCGCIFVKSTDSSSGSAGDATGSTYEVTVSRPGEGATAVVSVKDGETVKLKYADGTSPAFTFSYPTAAEFKSYSYTSASENTDFTYEDGVLTLMGDQLQPGIGFFVYEDATKSATVAVIYEDDGKITFNNSYYDCTQAAVNEGVTVETGEGTAPASVTAENTSYVAGTHYKYEDGTLTVLSDDLKGKILTIKYDELKAMIFVKND